MRCSKTKLWISASLDGELDSQRRDQLEAHLTSCHSCRAFAAELGQLNTALDLVSAEEPRWGFAGRVMARIDNAESESARPRFARPIPVGVGAATFCAGMALVILANGQTGTTYASDGDAIEVVASSYLGIDASPALSDELIDLLPQTED